MKKCLLFTAAILCISYFAHAQSTSGYIVTPAGDTVRGEIKVQKQVVSSITFKREASPTEETFTPAQLIAYGNRHYHYRSFSLNTGKESQSFFLKLVVGGSLNLYSLSNVLLKVPAIKQGGMPAKEIYFLQFANQPLLQLNQRSNLFLQDALNYLPDCPEVDKDIASMRYRYTEGSLSKMALTFNRCFTQPPARDYRVVPARSKVNFGLMAGANISVISREGLSRYTRYMQPTPGAGAGGAFFMNIDLTKRVAIRTSLGFAGKRSREADYLEIKLNYISIHQSVIFKAKGIHTQPYAIAGIGGGIGASSNIFIYPDYFYTHNDMVKSEFNASAGFGSLFKLQSRIPLLFEIKYELGVPQTRNPTIPVTNHAVWLKLGFLF